ncbi:DNA polymerase III subunit delta [Desulfotomaculum varum]
MEYYQSLLNNLARGQIYPVYLLYGPEEYLQEMAVEKFKEVLLPQAADFNLDLVDGETTEPAAVAALAENLPFLAERRLIIVKNTPWFAARGKAKDTGAKEAADSKADSQEVSLLNYLNNPSSASCLVFLSREPADRRKKLYKALTAVGQAIEFKTLKPSETISWVTQKLKAAHKKIDPAAARYLVEANGKAGLQNLSNELAKLLAYLGERDTVTFQDVRQLVVPSLEQNIFAVVDDAVAGHTSRAVAGIRELLAVKEQPPKILALLARQIRLALQAAALIQEGCPEREVAGKLGLQDFVVKKALQQARRSGSRKLQWALEQLAEIDADIKSGRQEFLPAIENTLIKLRLM